MLCDVTLPNYAKWGTTGSHSSRKWMKILAGDICGIISASAGIILREMLKKLERIGERTGWKVNEKEGKRIHHFCFNDFKTQNESKNDKIPI